MVVIGFSIVLDAVVAGFFAAHGLALREVAESSSLRLNCAAGAAGAFVASVTATTLMNEQLTDSNYSNALNFIVLELFKAKERSFARSG